MLVFLRNLLFLAFCFAAIGLTAQSSCDPQTPSFTVDLSSNPDSVWISPSTSRNGQCCGYSNPDKCIEFVITLHPDAVAIAFDWYTGAAPAGHQYQINCGTPVDVGEPVCLTGPGPHYLTYCKPGGNPNQYSITSISGVSTDSLTVGVGCDNVLKVAGLLDSSITWTSIFPGAIGDYDNLLSCTSGCDSTVVTPVQGSPIEIHYLVEGISEAPCGQTDTLSDTAVVYVYPEFDIQLADSLYSCTSPVTFEVEVNGGTPPYQITWSNGTTGASNSSSTSGWHVVEIVDSLACETILDSVYLEVYDGVEISNARVYQPSCHQGAGAIAVDINSPVAYNLRWSNGAITDSIFNLGAGSYELIAEDVNGCTDTAQFNIAAYSPLRIDSVSYTYNCNTELFNFTVHSAFTNFVSHSADSGTSFQSSNVFNGFTEGVYTFVIEDSNGCRAYYTKEFNKSANPAIDSLVFDNPSCNEQNGWIQVFASDPAVEYQLNNGAWQASNTFNNLGPGTYTITIRDSLGCTDQTSVSLINEGAPVIQIQSITNPSCASSDGAIQVAANGVASPFLFAIDNGAGTNLNYQSDSLFNNLPAGNYTLYVLDSNGCGDTAQVSLNEVNDMVISSIQSSRPGCDQSNGRIFVFASGGTGSLSYSIDGGLTFQSSNTFNNLPAGNYSIVVRDSLGCSRFQNYPLDEPNGPQIDLIEKTDASCDEDNGYIRIYASGGKTPYLYSIDGGASFGSSSIFNNLASGWYAIVVQDADSCKASDSVFIRALQPPSIAQANSTNAACKDVGGSISLSANGSRPIIFSINGGASYSSDSVFTNLSSGNYQVQIQDSSGCIADTVISVGNENFAQISQLTTSPEICGRANGSILIHASGDSLSFSIDGGTSYQMDSLFENLSAGTYTIVVAHPSGCDDTLVYTLNDTPGPSISATPTQDASCGLNNGEVSILHSNGTAPFTFSIDGQNYISSNSFTGLATGSYTAYVRDANGCLDSMNFSISSAPSFIWVAVDKVDPTCGNDNGEINIQVSGGTAPYQYSINGGTTFQSSSLFNSLSSGSYAIQVVDNRGCVLDTNISLNQLAGPFINSVAVVHTDCHRNTGSITVNANGNGSLEFTIDGTNFQSANSFTGLPSGSYSIAVRDSNNCLVDTTVEIDIINPAQIVNLTASPVTCGADNGNIQVSAMGGTKPYGFSLDGVNYQSDSLFTNLSAGNYTVYLLDDSACADMATISISEIAPPVLLLDGFSEASCVGNDGTVQFSVQDGTANFEFSLNGGAYQATGSFNNLDSGNYIAVVRDANGCTDSISFRIEQQDPINWSSFTTVDATCSQSNGSISVGVQGGEAPYLFSLNGSTFSSQSTFVNLPGGNYTIQVRDDRGCTKDTSIVLNQGTGPSLDSVRVESDICGRDTGIIQVFAGPAPLQYGIDGVFGSDSVFTGLSSGDYQVSIIDAQGCRVDTIVRVNNINGPVIDSVVTINTTCDSINGSLVIFADGNTRPFWYSVDDGISFQSDSAFVNIGPGTYDVVVTDSNGCEARTQVYISANPSPYIDTVYVQDVYCEGSNGEATVSVLSGEPPYEFSLNNGPFGTDSVFSNLNAGFYGILIRDNRGCLDSIYFQVDSIPAPTWNSFDINHASCDSNNASIQVTVQGGVQPYVFELNGVQSSNGLFNNLNPGAYTLSVIDSSGCQLDSNFTINQLGTPTVLSINVQDEDCGQQNGSIEINASGNTPFTYLLNGTNAQSSNLFTGLEQGFYTISIVDTNGCIFDTNARVFTTDGPRISSFLIDSSSCGENNGSVEVNAFGGDLPYRYVVDSDTGSSNLIDSLAYGWHYVQVLDAKDCYTLDSIFVDSIPALRFNGAVLGTATCNSNNGWIKLSSINGLNAVYAVDAGGFSSVDSIAGLAPGWHMAYVQDDRSCMDSLPFFVDSIAPVQALSIDITHATCDTDNGSISINPLDGRAPFSYSIDGGQNYQSTGQFTGLAAGTYSLVVLDSTACRVDSTVQINQLSRPQIQNISFSNELCDKQNGQINASATGNGTLLYSIDGVNYQSSGLFDSLSAGFYSIYILDTNACLLDSIVELEETPGAFLSVQSKQDPSCSEWNGMVSLRATGGGGNYLFSEDGVNYQVSPIFDSIAPGTHWFYLRDGWSCEDSIQVSFNDQPGPMLVGIDSVYNCGNRTYDIEIQASGGNGNLLYSIDGGVNQQLSNQFSGLAPGQYQIHIQDALSCVFDTVYQLNSRLPLLIDSLWFDPPACSNSDGSIAVFASGLSPFVYSLDGINYDSINSFNNLAPGTYTVYVKDSLGCVISRGITLSNSAAPTIAIDGISNPNCGRYDGRIEVSANGAAAPFMFALDSTGGALQYAAQHVFDSLGPGSYVLWAIDTNGCETSQSIHLFEVNNMVINSILASSPSCNGSDGSLDIQGSGGTPPLTYSIDSGLTYQPNGYFDSLSAGEYHIFVTDVNGCSRSQMFNLTDPQGPQVDLVEYKPRRCALQNGEIRVFASNGTQPLRFSIDGGLSFQASPYFTGLDTGMYTVIVRDAKHCEAMDSVEIGILPAPEWGNILVSDMNCNSSLGQIHVQVFGIEPILYSIDGGNNYQSDSAFYNLNAGSYQIRIVDSAGCILDSVVRILNHKLANISSVETKPEICGRLNGELSIQVSGDRSAIQYSIDGGRSFQLDSLFVGLSAGTYQVHVLDTLTGCSSDTVVSLTELLAPTLSAQANPSTCDSSNGSISLTANGTTGPFEFSLDSVNYSSQSSFTGLAPGFYRAYVRDTNACVSELLVQVQEIQLLEISALELVDATCDSVNASVIISARLGSRPYQYSIDGGASYVGDSIFNNLASGTYVLQVLDANGCSVDSTIELNQLSGPSVFSAAIRPEICGRTNGEIQVIAQGNGALQYSLNGAAYQGSGRFTGLNQGQYVVSILDTNGCLLDTTLQIDHLLAPEIDSIQITESTCAMANGQISVFATGAQMPFAYSLDGVQFQSSNIFTNLAVGSYTVYVRDTNNCEVSTAVVLDSIRPPRIERLDQLSTTCGLDNGSVIIVGSGGTSPYEYSLNGFTYQSSNTFNSLAEGTYMAYLRDVNMCVDSLPFTIDSVPSPSLAFADVVDATCSSSNGVIELHVQGGDAPFSFSIDNGVSYSSDSVFIGLAANTYYISIVDGLGCEWLDTIVVMDLEGPSVKGSSQEVATCSYQDGSITLHAEGNGPFMYAIGGPSDYQTDSTFNNLASGSYELWVRDSNGCEVSVVVDLDADYSLQSNMQINGPGEGCTPYTTQFSLEVAGVKDSCRWDLGDGTIVYNCDPFYHTYVQPDCYDVSVYVRLADECAGDSLFEDQACVLDIPEPDFVTYPGEVFQELEPISTRNFSIDADSVNWYIDGVWVSSAWQPTLRHELSDEDSLVQICLETFNNSGCADSICVWLRAEGEFHWFIANAFTPNGDNKNEFFAPVFSTRPDEPYEFRIFDRWGEIVYSTGVIGNAWDGVNRRFPGTPPKEDVYIWELSFINPVTNSLVKAQGRVTLLL